MKKNIRNIILNIKTKLPEPARKSLSWFYHKWSIKIDQEIVKNLAEYSNINEDEVIWLMNTAKRLDGDLWRISNPRTKEEIEKFYKENPFYIFGLAFWHMKRYQVEFRNEIIKYAKGDVLDFGGGIGDLCFKLKKMGLNCDYADLGGRIFNFAKWFFEKNGCKIKMIDLTHQEITKKYETIFCIDVIEHISEPEKELKKLSENLKEGGRMIITNLNIPKTDKHPMHFATKLGSKKYLNELGLYESEKEWLWIKK